MISGLVKGLAWQESVVYLLDDLIIVAERFFC